MSLADSSGTVQTEYSYEPFGLTTASGTTSGNELRYTGREDDGTSLYYYRAHRARYYHPTLQRFVGEIHSTSRPGTPTSYAPVWLAGRLRAGSCRQRAPTRPTSGTLSAGSLTSTPNVRPSTLTSSPSSHPASTPATPSRDS